jgi:hypothetical protein
MKVNESRDRVNVRKFKISSRIRNVSVFSTIGSTIGETVERLASPVLFITRGIDWTFLAPGVLA